MAPVIWSRRTSVFLTSCVNGRLKIAWRTGDVAIAVSYSRSFALSSEGIFLVVRALQDELIGKSWSKGDRRKEGEGKGGLKGWQEPKINGDFPPSSSSHSDPEIGLPEFVQGHRDF